VLDGFIVGHESTESSRRDLDESGQRSRRSCRIYRSPKPEASTWRSGRHERTTVPQAWDEKLMEDWTRRERVDSLARLTLMVTMGARTLADIEGRLRVIEAEAIELGAATRERDGKLVFQPLPGHHGHESVENLATVLANARLAVWNRQIAEAVKLATHCNAQATRGAEGNYLEDCVRGVEEAAIDAGVASRGTGDELVFHTYAPEHLGGGVKELREKLDALRNHSALQRMREDGP